MRHIELVTALKAMGWVDSSYGNDASDSMGFSFNEDSGEWLYRLWVADADYDEREEGEPRYTLVSDLMSCTTDSAREIFEEISQLPEMEEIAAREESYLNGSGR